MDISTLQLANPTLIKSFDYTDELKKSFGIEIKTKEKKFVVISSGTYWVDFSIKSNSEQSIKTLLALKAENYEILKVEKVIGAEIKTNKFFDINLKKDVGQEYVEYTYEEVEIEEKDGVKDIVIERGDLFGLEHTKQFIDNFKAGEEKFYRILLKLDGEAQFIFESFGSNNEYGYLDPWTYTQDFDSLTTGDLDSQDSWTADTTIDVQETTVFAGSKALKFDGYGIATRTITSTSAGTMYLVHRIDTINNGGDGLFMQHKSSSGGYLSVFKAIYVSATTFKIQCYTSSGYQDAFTLDEDTWYIFKIEYDYSAHTFKIAYKTSGGTWSSWSSTFTTNSSDTSATLLKFGQDTGWVGYLDEISDADPDVPSTTTFIPRIIMT